MAVVRIEIDRREPVLNGASFGEAGAYEKIVGMLYFAVDPSLPVNERIADIQRRLLLDVPNRGRKVALGMLNSTPRSNDPTSPADDAVAGRAGRLWDFIHEVKPRVR